jgi:restriction system protein
MPSYRNPQVDDSYRYPPELLELLVETIPLLVKSKDALIDFFRGSKVPNELLSGWQARVRQDRKGVSKYEITRDVLCALNERHDTAIAPRREVIKRIATFDDFSTCWESDRLKAEGLVLRIRSVVDIKDALTRRNNERKLERQAQARAELEAKARWQEEIEAVRRGFSALFAIADTHERGKALAAVLNRLFACYGVTVKEAFSLKENAGEGIIEHVDGLIDFEGDLYLVEMRWSTKPIGTREIGPHLVRVYNRGDVRGIFISASGYSEAAITDRRFALQQKVFVLFDLEELVMLLEHHKDLKELIRAKVYAAVAERGSFASEARSE